MIHYLCILWNDHHNESNWPYMIINSFSSDKNFKVYSLGSLHICNMILIILTTLYIISPWLTYFITRSLYLLTPFTQFAFPCLWQQPHVSMRFFVFVCFGFFLSPHISETLISGCCQWALAWGLIFIFSVSSPPRV